MTRLIYGIDLGANQPVKSIERMGDPPTLLIHASGDNVIPASQAEELAQAGQATPASSFG